MMRRLIIIVDKKMNLKIIKKKIENLILMEFYQIIAQNLLIIIRKYMEKIINKFVVILNYNIIYFYF